MPPFLVGSPRERTHPGGGVGFRGKITVKKSPIDSDALRRPGLRGLWQVLGTTKCLVPGGVKTPDLGRFSSTPDRGRVFDPDLSRFCLFFFLRPQILAVFFFLRPQVLAAHKGKPQNW